MDCQKTTSADCTGGSEAATTGVANSIRQVRAARRVHLIIGTVLFSLDWHNAYTLELASVFGGYLKGELS